MSRALTETSASRGTFIGTSVTIGSASRTTEPMERWARSSTTASAGRQRDHVAAQLHLLQLFGSRVALAAQFDELFQRCRGENPQ